MEGDGSNGTTHFVNQLLIRKGTFIEVLLRWQVRLPVGFNELIGLFQSCETLIESMQAMFEPFHGWIGVARRLTRKTTNETDSNGIDVRISFGLFLSVSLRCLSIRV